MKYLKILFIFYMWKYQWWPLILYYFGMSLIWGKSLAIYLYFYETKWINCITSHFTLPSCSFLYLFCLFPCSFEEEKTVIKNQNINSGGGSSNNNDDITRIHQTGDKKKETSFPSWPQLQNRLKTTDISIPITLNVCVHTDMEKNRRYTCSAAYSARDRLNAERGIQAHHLYNSLFNLLL